VYLYSTQSNIQSTNSVKKLASISITVCLNLIFSAPIFAESYTTFLEGGDAEFNNRVQKNEQWREEKRRRDAEAARQRSQQSSTKCVSISADVTCDLCMAESIKISGGPGQVDNSWSSPMICSGYQGALNGTYSYVLKTGGGKICSGSFALSSKAKSGATVVVYNDCRFNYLSEW